MKIQQMNKKLLYRRTANFGRNCRAAAAKGLVLGAAVEKVTSERNAEQKCSEREDETPLSFG